MAVATLSLISFILLTVSPAFGSLRHIHRDHDDIFHRSLPEKWYRSDNHPVNALFKRDPSGPPVGTKEWADQYPPPTVRPIANIPQEWLDALHATEAAGMIPNVPVSFAPPDLSNPVYPQGVDPGNKDSVCSSTAKCRQDDDIWDGPDGTLSIGFDDGPEEGSQVLYDFLQQNKIPSTHFMIGGNIVYGSDTFLRAFNELKADIAVHTYTHPHMTNMTNEQVLAELAWTMKIITDLTGGRIPKYWRPPFGDSDNRVRAIAKNVLGLSQINWNQDSADWHMRDGSTTLEKVVSDIEGWYAGPKSPGLIVLEHELTLNTSTAFIQSWPKAQSNGWKIDSTLQILGGAYKNAKNNDAPAQPMVLVPSQTAAPLSTTTSTTSASSSTTSRSPVVLPQSTSISTASSGGTSANTGADSQESNKPNGATLLNLPSYWSCIVIAAFAIFMA